MDLPEVLSMLQMGEDELREAVIGGIVASVLETKFVDEDGCEDSRPSLFRGSLHKRAKEAIDAHIRAVAESELLPLVAAAVDNVCLQKTNKWGETIGSPTTFREYLAQTANEFLQQSVDMDGKPVTDHYNRSRARPRIVHFVEEHLAGQIAEAMKDAHTNVREQLAEAIASAAREKLAKLAETVTCKLETNRTR